MFEAKELLYYTVRSYISVECIIGVLMSFVKKSRTICGQVMRTLTLFQNPLLSANIRPLRQCMKCSMIRLQFLGSTVCPCIRLVVRFSVHPEWLSAETTIMGLSYAWPTSRGSIMRNYYWTSNSSIVLRNWNGLGVLILECVNKASWFFVLVKLIITRKHLCVLSRRTKLRFQWISTRSIL